MLAKLCVLIVGLGVLACLLLGTRQLRTQAAHEMADVQKRVARHDRELWKLRSEIARRITPDKVELLARGFGDLQPISAERYRVMVRLEAEEAGETTVTMGGR
ncbi:MAG TPA: hypothetical protein PKE29_03765 [Phycisphaerales bacterium]|nr:hypothetical protein [Phycisphaerales bacterium]